MPKILFLAGLWLVSASGYANVKQTNQEFFASDISSDATVFWGEILTLKQWESKPRSQWLRIDQHPQYTALANGQAERSYPELTQADISQVLGDQLGAEFFVSYSQKDEEYLEIQQTQNFKPQSALMFEVKIARTVATPVDAVVKAFENSVQLLNQMDQPHRHIEVSQDFASRLIEPLHSGHEMIESMNSSDRLVFSVIRLEDYQCSVMSQLLDLATEVHGESVPEIDGKPIVNLYSLSRISRIADGSLARYAEIFGEVPAVVFEQDMIYSSRFVKDVKNIWALIPTDDGQTRIASYTVMATTEKFKSALSLALTGPTPKVLGELVSNKTSQAADQVVAAADNLLDSLLGNEGTNASRQSSATSKFPMTMSSDVVDLNSSSLLSACDTGLTKGIPKYLLGMYEGLLSQF